MKEKTTSEVCGSNNPEAHVYNSDDVAPYNERSNESLGRLLEQFGRNGPMNDIQQRAHDQIEAVLAERRKEGLIYTDDGQVVSVGQG